MTIVNEAIDAALKSDWKKAIDLNCDILISDENNIDALNRLGFAYLKLGKPKKAESAFNKVLKQDPFNPIACKNLKKIKGHCLKIQNNHQVSPKIFLEEPGITKIVNLINQAPKIILATIVCGQPLVLNHKKHTVEVRTDDNTYLGALPDDLSFRLRKLIKLGNEYDVYAKSYDEKSLIVIIKETKRSKKVKDASFTVKLIPDYHTSIRSDLLEELIENDSDSAADSSEPDKEDEE